jgi:DNA-binding HxlR family transcriptional regulator
MAHAPHDRPHQPASAAIDERPVAAADQIDGLADALLTVGDRWSLAIVACLLEGPQPFGSLQRRLPAISPNVLSQRLRDLGASGVLVARPYSRRPLRCTYELTGAGQELADALRLLADWGARRAGGPSQAPQHALCETPLEVRWYCPTCAEPVPAPAGDVQEELYLA